MTTSTHAYCPACKEDSAIDREGNCLWCNGPTQSRRRGGKPKGVHGKLQDRHLRALNCFHVDQGVSIRELGRRVWEQAGYASEHSAAESISKGFRRLGLPSLSQSEATAKANEARRASGSPGTADRRAYKRYLRKKSGGYRRCAGTKLQAPGAGRPCKRFALDGSDFCLNHDPDRRAEVVARVAAMRAQLPEGEVA